MHSFAFVPGTLLSAFSSTNTRHCRFRAPGLRTRQPLRQPARRSRTPCLDGTPVKLRLSQTISSADAKVGQEIPFEVVEEVKVDDVVVLPKGATAIGTVTDCNAKKSMGRAGKLNINISYARLADQEKVALRATQDNKGGGHVGAMTGAMVATSIVFFPAAPLFLFMNGQRHHNSAGHRDHRLCRRRHASEHGQLRGRSRRAATARPNCCSPGLTRHRLRPARRGHRDRRRICRQHAFHRSRRARKPRDHRQEKGIRGLDTQAKRYWRQRPSQR